MIIELDKRKSIFENASVYFEKAKKLKDKLKKLEAQINETKEKLSQIDKEIEDEKRKLEKKRKKKWYEKFRWFYTSNEFLLIAGKDAITNEILIRKYLEPNDLVFHAEIHGSPFGILKRGKNAGEIDIFEAAQFVASYSKAWKQKLAYIEVYYVYPEQVSKQAPAGEYLPKGSFMIYGRKNYVKVKLEIALGVDSNNNLIPGVPSSVSKKSINYVILVPGNKKPLETAKEISSFLRVSVDDVLPFIPGESEIVKKVNSIK